MQGEELVDDLGEDLVRDERRVVFVGYEEPGDAFGSGVAVEGVGWGRGLSYLGWMGPRRGGGGTLLFDVLALAGAGALGDGFAEEGHELAVAGRGEE